MEYIAAFLVVKFQQDSEHEWVDRDIGKSIDVEFRNPSIKYQSVGIVYISSEHFTCRIRDRSDTYWFYNSARFAKTAQPEDRSKLTPSDLLSHGDMTRHAYLCI